MSRPAATGTPTLEGEIPAPTPDRPAAPAGHAAPAPDGADRPRRASLVSRSEPFLWGLVGILASLLAWQLLWWSEVVPRSGLPSPGEVLRSAGQLVGDGVFMQEYADTLGTWAVSLLISAVAGVVLGILIGYFPPAKKATSLLIDIGRSIPTVTLIPVGIVVLGLGPEMKVAVVSLAIVWLVLINTIYGVASIDPLAFRSARAMRFSRVTTLRVVVLPASVPFIASGIRIAAGVAFVVTLAAELLGATTGVGTVIVRYQNGDQVASVFAGVLIISVTGLVLSALIQAAERRIVRWRPEES
jgi:NitT/TauT family transport system permease protein